MQDLTKGNEFKVLFFFSLPILIGNVFQQFYNLADSIIVGRVLGKENLAAVGFCFQINLILIALSMGLTMGVGILISRHFGAKDYTQIGVAIDTNFRFSLILSVIVCLCGLLLSPAILKLFQVPADTAGFALIYLRIIFLGAIPTFLYNTITNILRGLGDSKSPVYFLIGATLINISLDLLFVKQMNFGIAGAAVATVISQTFSFVGSLLWMHAKYKEYPIHVLHGTYESAVLKESLKIGIPSMMQQLFRSIGFMALQGMVNSFGSNCMAAYAATTKIDSFAQLPAMNLGQALSNFTAQNRGAHREDRARRGFRAALTLGLAISITISCIVVPSAPFLIRLFGDDLAVIEIGCTYLKIVGVSYGIEALMQILNGILLGYEKPFIPLISTIVSLCLMQVPAAFLLSQFTDFGSTGIWMATPFGWTGGVAIRIFYYMRNVSPKHRKTA